MIHSILIKVYVTQHGAAVLGAAWLDAYLNRLKPACELTIALGEDVNMDDLERATIIDLR